MLTKLTNASSNSITYNIILLLLALLIFLANSVTLVAIIKHRHLHVPNIIFVAGMALADCAFGGISLPLRYISTLDNDYSFETCFTMKTVYLYFCDVTVFMLLGFTFDRLYAIRFPFHYHKHVDCRIAMISVGVLWLVGILSSYVPELVMSEELIDAYKGKCSLFSVIPRHYLADFRFYQYIFTLTVLIAVNCYTVLVVRKHRKTMARLSVGLALLSPVGAKAVKSEILLLSMICVFTVCRLPLAISNMVWAHSDIQSPPEAFQLLSIVYYTNSLLNPVVYAYRNKRIFKAIKLLFLCKSFRKTMSMTPSDEETTRMRSNKSSCSMSNKSPSLPLSKKLEETPNHDKTDMDAKSSDLKITDSGCLLGQGQYITDVIHSLMSKESTHTNRSSTSSNGNSPTVLM